MARAVLANVPMQTGKAGKMIDDSAQHADIEKYLPKFLYANSEKHL